MCGVFAEFERSMMREHIVSGLARAKAAGVEMGRGKRKDGEQSADEERRVYLRLHKARTGILKIGKELGVRTSVVQRVVHNNPFEASSASA
jgi:DNA invertase Pin-like site-specific DNA recombinase